MNGIDIVAIYSEYTQVFTDAKIIKAQVRETSKSMDHPVESGTSITDHKVINPITMTILVSANRDTYTQLLNAYEKSTVLNVQSKVRLYKDMIITDIPHDEDADHFDTFVIGIALKQIFTVKPAIASVTKPKYPQNANGTDRGSVQTKSSSVLYEVFQ